jgi:hypothetical protein
MKSAEFQGPAPIGPPTNGTHPHPKAAVMQKRSRRQAGVRPAAEEALPAPFAPIEAEAIDAPMWPIHTTIWFQPDLAPEPPSWSGLAVERRNRIPAPGFLNTDAAPPNRSAVPETSCVAMPANGRPELPESDLEPLGWDARAVLWKEERE